MTKLELAKNAVSIVVGAGASKIVSSIIQNNTNPKTLADKVSMSAGSVVIGMMVADAAKKYTDAQIDEIAAWYKANAKKS